MPKPVHIRLSDLRGFQRLANDATVGLTDLVEAMHHTVLRTPGILGKSPTGRTAGITGFVYKSVRGITRLVGGGVDALLGILAPLLADRPSSEEREAILAAINGIFGDYLVASGNPLAVPMQLRKGGVPVPVNRAALATAFPDPGRKIAVLVHGLCMNDLQWARKGHDHGAALARELGYAPVYLHYNTGLHVSTSGREFGDLMETLLRQWPQPVERLIIIGHSMGGLVARSACHYAARAGHAWPKRLDELIFLGTPHLGAPLERAGAWVDFLMGISPYTAPFARLGRIRSAGIKDLRHGYLRDEDWQTHPAATVRDRPRISSATRRSALLCDSGDQAGTSQLVRGQDPRRRAGTGEQRSRPRPPRFVEPWTSRSTAMGGLRNGPFGPAESRCGLRTHKRVADGGSWTVR